MIKTRTLNNGTTIIMEKTDYVQSAALGIWVRSGAAYETDDISGMSHYIEHMMFKGTTGMSAKEIAEAVDRIGGSSNAFTGKEATCYYIKTLTSNIYKGAEILLDMVTESVFDTDEMDKERNVILEEIKMVKDCPDDEIYDTISELVNSGNPLRMNILGNPESLSNIDRSQMMEYFRKRYARDGIVIAITGDFDEEKLCSIFEKGLESLNSTSDRPEFTAGSYRSSFDVKVKDIEQTHICLATPGISMVDDKYFSFVLMNNIFGGSMSSRLFQNIREEKGLAYSVSSMNVFNSGSGFFNIYAGVAHEKAEEAIEAVRYELNSLAHDGVSEDELAMAKEQVKSSYIFGLENINSRMFSLGKNLLLLDRIYTPEEILSGFNSVTREDITQSAQVISDFANYCGATVTGKDLELDKLVRG